MEPFWQFVLTIVTAVLASSGLWGIIQKKMDKNDSFTSLLRGIGHDRIIFLGTQYIKRGWISEHEYENLYTYLYLPYKKMGGNGTAEKVIKDVSKLPIRSEGD